MAEKAPTRSQGRAATAPTKPPWYKRMNGWRDLAMLLLAAIVAFTVARVESWTLRDQVRANRADINEIHGQQGMNITRLDEHGFAIEGMRSRLLDAESKGDNTASRVDGIYKWKETVHAPRSR